MTEKALSRRLVQLRDVLVVFRDDDFGLPPALEQNFSAAFSMLADCLEKTIRQAVLLESRAEKKDSGDADKV